MVNITQQINNRNMNGQEIMIKNTIFKDMWISKTCCMWRLKTQGGNVIQSWQRNKWTLV